MAEVYHHLFRGGNGGLQQCRKQPIRYFRHDCSWRRSISSFETERDVFTMSLANVISNNETEIFPCSNNILQGTFPIGVGRIYVLIRCLSMPTRSFLFTAICKELFSRCEESVQL